MIAAKLSPCCDLTMTALFRLLPEWTPQEAVILAWPDKSTDWAPWLPQVQQVYLHIIRQLNQAGTGVLLLIKQQQLAQCQSMLTGDENILFIPADYNDTWVRDYAFLTCQSGDGLSPVEFEFNGWGDKFAASKDNRVNRDYLAPLCQLPLRSAALVAEGGALEIDGRGHLLSTQLCLFNRKRNGNITPADYQQQFTQALGCSQLSILSQGHLQGDDTDGHIDTLVRFTPHQGLVIQACLNRPADSHYAGLSALVDECAQVLPEHQLFTLPLPLVTNSQGERLPASYANYLISNQQILCPTYQQDEDRLALETIQRAYPHHQVVAINCLPLVQQYGSLHCISMQVPKGTLKAEVMAQLNSGVSIYA